MGGRAGGAAVTSKDAIYLVVILSLGLSMGWVLDDASDKLQSALAVYVKARSVCEPGIES